VNNIYVLNKSYKKIGTLSNQGANPQAPYYEDLYTQELETGADTYQFSTTSSKYTQDILEIGNHIMFAYKNRNELFTITSLEYSHNEGYKTIGVYAEGIGFDLLEIFMKRPEINKENSGNNGGNDFDNDGDDNTDGEYADPDHFYIDETGVIIWDKDGSGPPSEDDITIDGDGNIIYRPSKNNKKNDSLEFKNISYPRFLSILLKDSGWSYVCQPGLESVKHDITVRYDTNIFALLQDSMQSYRGVELEFVHELVGGKVQKVIKAYKDGGRGSFVGKRFEYGTNVRGITKMQEVANSEDDTVLYVDNVGIAVQYDVDFALKSAEVPEIEIGDTHYVIDRDFCPPMQIKARIGKIEISFSDPTKNKIYLANNKKISGSAIEDEFGADDVADMLDDYEFDGDGDSGAAYDHYHDRLICDYTRVSKDPITGEENGTASYQTSVILDGHGLLPDWHDYYNLGSKDKLWRYIYTSAVDSNNIIMSPRYLGYNYHVYFDRDDMEDVVKITDSSEVTKQDLLNYIMNDLNVYEYSAKKVNEANNEDVDDPDAYFPNQIYFGLLSEDVYDHGNPCSTSEVGLRLSGSLVRNDTNNDGDKNDNDGHNAHTYNIPALLAALIGAFQHYVSGGRVTTNSPSPKDQNAGYEGGKNPDPFDPDDPGTGEGGDNPGTDNPGTGTITGTFDVAEGNKLIAEEIKVQRKDGTAGQLDVFGKLYVTEEIKCELLMETNTLNVDTIEFSDGSTLTSANGLSGEGVTPGTGNVFDTITVRKIQGPDPGENQYNRVEFADAIGVSHIYCASEDDNDVIFIGDHVSLHAGMTLLSNIQLQEDGCIEFPDGSRLTTANGLGSGGGSSTDNITANKITIGTPTDSKASKCSLCVKGNTLVEGNLYIEGGNGLYVNGTPGSDKSLKENIRYVDNTGTIIVDKENLETRDYHNEDLLEKTDLHDFIVNQVNICEYNFIGKDRNKIGFIANEYEGTKVGDKIVSRDKELDLLFYDSDNLLFATIGALQEEVRTKDEKIASLEARLERIEALLSNNDN
jgi:hypothetical protein